MLVASGSYLPRPRKWRGTYPPLATDTEVNNCYLTLFIYAIYFMSKLWIFFFHSQNEPDTLSLLMDSFYLDNSDLQLFAIFIFEVDFSDTFHDKC